MKENKKSWYDFCLSLAVFIIPVPLSIGGYAFLILNYINPEILGSYEYVAENQFQSSEFVEVGARGMTVVRFKDGSSCELTGRLDVPFQSGSKIKVSCNAWAWPSERYRIEKVE